MRYLIILLLFLVCTAHGEDRDTMYWDVTGYDTIIDYESMVVEDGELVHLKHLIPTWQRRPARWTCRVDTNYLEQGTIGGMIVGTTTYDTTWIPLAPVFVDTTKIGVEIRNIRNIDTLDLPIPQRNLREWLNRQADKSFFEAVKQLIEEYEQ